MKYLFFLIPYLFTMSSGIPSKYDSFQKLVKNFEQEYQQLNIPPLELSYVNNLKNVGSLDDHSKQTSFFDKYQKLLKEVEVQSLSDEEQVIYAVLLYEIDLNLQRIRLSSQWLAGDTTIEGTKVYNEQLGKEWYAYFLKKWVDKDLTPDAAYKFGLKEVEQVKQQMKRIRKQMGLNQKEFDKQLKDRSYYLSDNDEILERYDRIKKTVMQKAAVYFPDLGKTPAFKIEAGTNENMAIAPAYYHNNTFYYNFFDASYDSRDMGWIFIHEAIPGHHYQLNLAEQIGIPTNRLFQYMGYLEGWAAYVEQYGDLLGAYDSPMDAYGHLRWDLIRSVRVVLDVGLNYYGWSDEKAMKFWNKHISNQESIAKREIKRMKRWPAQVITYKYGKQVLDELRGDRSSATALKAFHQQVLQYGAIPLSVLKNHIQKNKENE